MVPWLCAIPLAVGGGYVSDVLINKGANPAAINVYVIFLFQDVDCFFFPPVGYSVIFVRKLMQVNLLDVSINLGFPPPFFSNMNLQVCIDAQGTRALEF